MMFGDVYHSYEGSDSSRPAARPVPGFLKSLFAIVSDPGTDDVVSWNAEGTCFTIHDVSRFSSEVLPQYYKHNNFSSFSRQLNFYSFKKVVDEDDDSGYLIATSKPNTFEYRHRYFQRGRPDLLYRVVRKTNASAIKELAAEEKADRAKRKRDGEMFAQLSSLTGSSAQYGRPAAPSMNANLTQMLMAAINEGQHHNQHHAFHGSNDAGSMPCPSGGGDYGGEGMDKAEDGGDNEAAVQVMKQLVSALSGSLSGLQGNLQSLLTAGAAVIPLLACQSNASGSDFTELLMKSSNTNASLADLLGPGFDNPGQAGGAGGSGPLISPSLLSDALHAVPHQLRNSLMLSALAGTVQNAVGEGSDLLSPGSVPSMTQLTLQSPPGKMNSTRSGDHSWAGGVDDSEDDDEMRALRNMRLRSRVRRRTLSQAEAEAERGTSDQEQGNSLAERRRVKRPRALDADAGSFPGPNTCDGVMSPWSSMQSLPSTTMMPPPTAPARLGHSASRPDNHMHGLQEVRPDALSVTMGLAVPNIETPVASSGLAMSPAPASSLLSPSIMMHKSNSSHLPSASPSNAVSSVAKDLGIATSPANASTLWDMFLSMPTPSAQGMAQFARTPLAGWLGSMTPSLLYHKNSGPGALPYQPKPVPPAPEQTCPPPPNQAPLSKLSTESGAASVLSGAPPSGPLPSSSALSGPRPVSVSVSVDAPPLPSTVFSPSMLLLKGTSPVHDPARLRTGVDRKA